MPKVFKLTESQLVALKEHIKSVKTLQEDISEPDNLKSKLSAAARGYYDQNGIEPKKEEVIPEEEVPIANPAEEKKIADALVTLGLQVIPGTKPAPPTATKPTAPTPGSTEALSATTAAGDPGLIGEVEPVANAKPEPEYAEVEEMLGDYNFNTPVRVTSTGSDALYRYCSKNNFTPNGDDIMPEGDIEIDGQLVVSWSIKIESGATGITNMKVLINGITGDLTYSYYLHSLESDNDDKGEFTKPFNFKEWKITSGDILKIKTDMDTNDCTITITTADLDWNRMELTIY